MNREDKRKALKKEKKFIAPEKRNLTPEECLELQEIQRMVNNRVFEYNQIKANTALIPRGQEVAKEVEAIARLLDQVKRQWIGAKLQACGYSASYLCDINLTTGEIIPHK